MTALLLAPLELCRTCARTEAADRRTHGVTGTPIRVVADVACSFCDDQGYDEGPSCSLCDALGHGYPGGGPCPLEERAGGYDGEPEWAI